MKPMQKVWIKTNIKFPFDPHSKNAVKSILKEYNLSEDEQVKIISQIETKTISFEDFEKILVIND